VTAPVTPTGATIVDRRPITMGDVERVLRDYDIGEPIALPVPAGGTANANCRVETSAGTFILRRRNPKYAVPAYVAFDHRLMEHMAAHGVPTPLAIRSRSGLRWTVVAGDTFEVFPFRPGNTHDRNSIEQIRSAGAALARFHLAAASFEPPPGKEWPRYDDPMQVRAGLREMSHELPARLTAADLAYLQDQVARVERELPDQVYGSLPRHVIHGDFHPANVLYVGDAVAGIYDLDWCTVQPRVRDIADGLIFFAGSRDGDVTSSDIRKLTRTWRHAPDRSRAFLDAYSLVNPISRRELALLPVFMTARWLHCRTIGRSKVAPDERIAFFLDGLLDPLRSLEPLTALLEVSA